MNYCTITAAHNKHFYNIFHHYVKGKNAFGLNSFLIDRQQKSPRAPIKVMQQNDSHLWLRKVLHFLKTFYCTAVIEISGLGLLFMRGEIFKANYEKHANESL